MFPGQASQYVGMAGDLYNNFEEVRALYKIASDELGEAPQRADGANEKKMQKEREIKQLSADQILADEKMHDMWMRQIQQDPSRFLSVKFQMQLRREAKDE